MSAGGYSPSPRPTFDRPTAIRGAAATRHIWGDAESGEVADRIYASTDRIHALVFCLPRGGSFRHSREYRTVFGADEVLQVLSGTMVAANPETGEVHRVERGERLLFGPGTWHHAFAHGGEALEVLEFFAPPPSTGTSGAYARTRPYLERVALRRRRRAREHAGRAACRGRCGSCRPADVVWRRDLGVLTGIVASTEHLTVVTHELNPGEAAAPHAHGGRRAPVRALGSPVGAGVARRGGARVRARGRATRATCRSATGTSTETTARASPRRSRGSLRAYLP